MILKLLSFVAFVLFANFLIGASNVKSFIDLAVLAGATLMFFRWLPSGIESVTNGGRQKKFRLALAVTLFALAILIQRIYIIAVTNQVFPNWLGETDVGTFIASLIFIPIFLGLTVDETPEEFEQNLQNYYALLLLGVLIVIAIFGFQRLI